MSRDPPMSKDRAPPPDDLVKLAMEAASLADAMRPRAESLGDDDLAARAACFAVPMRPWRPGFDHVSFWPGRLDEFKPGARVDDLTIAAAYLLLSLERQVRSAQLRAA